MRKMVWGLNIVTLDTRVFNSAGIHNRGHSIGVLPQGDVGLVDQALVRLLELR